MFIKSNKDFILCKLFEWISEKFLKYFFLNFLLFLSSLSFAQTAFLKGKVISDNGVPLEQALIVVDNIGVSDQTDKAGDFSLILPANRNLIVVVKIIGYKEKIIPVFLKPEEKKELFISLEPEISKLAEVEVLGTNQDKKRVQPGTFHLNAKDARYLPSTFGDFNKLIQTLPGVGGNNELSSQYTVRGGNFDENLVYVNDIEIYRPFIVRSGQQEGLSFVNPDLVKDVEFSSGGWQPRYGDKLSSVLSIQYKEPKKFKGSLSLGLLGGAAHLENVSKNKKISYLAGVRSKNSQYLLNTLPVKGDYKPRFYDFQGIVNFDLTRKEDENTYGKRTSLSILASYAQNRYFIQPQERETSFGTSFTPLQLKVGFEGQEILQYDSYQSGIKLSHLITPKLKTDLILSGLYTQEREYFDIESGYRLCEVVDDPNSNKFNTCSFVRGIGSTFEHARNKLNANIINLNHRGYYDLSPKSQFQWGIGGSKERIEDKVSEYSFSDSALFITNLQAIESSATLNSIRGHGYLQHTIIPDTGFTLTYGVRFNYWSLNKQYLYSPRLQFAWQPDWERNIIFRVGLGIYQQPPFYRELRDKQGKINDKVKAQTSYQFISGMDWNFNVKGKKYKFLSEVYYKYLTNVIPYDVENIRLRYFASNAARAYAAGIDFRVNGEFIKGTESWFSLGLLTTREDVEGDGVGYIRRPTDQRVTAAIFFQDNLPNNPSLKMYLNLLFGSGLPFGPPGSIKYRNFFTSPTYKRVDIGFSKLLSLSDKKISGGVIESIWLAIEVLNLIGASNTYSYLWVKDYSGNSFAVPNTLSARFLNIRTIIKF